MDLYGIETMLINMGIIADEAFNWTYMELKPSGVNPVIYTSDTFNWTYMELKLNRQEGSYRVMGLLIGPIWN